jgi:hypothetical protein
MASYVIPSTPTHGPESIGVLLVLPGMCTTTCTCIVLYHGKIFGVVKLFDALDVVSRENHNKHAY